MTRRDFKENYGGGFLKNHFNDSPSSCIITVFSELKLLPWRFPIVPVGYWDSVNNRRAYVAWLSKTVGASHDTSLTAKDFRLNHGGGLLERFGQSPRLVLESLFELDTSSLNRPSVNSQNISHSINTSSGSEERGIEMANLPVNYWASIPNQRAFLEKFLKKLNISFLEKSTSDGSWQEKITVKAITENGGAGLLARYNNSPYLLLRTVFPEIEFHPWQFKHLPKNLWKDDREIANLVNYVDKAANIAKAEDWYRVSSAQLNALGSSFVVLFEKVIIYLSMSSFAL